MSLPARIAGCLHRHGLVGAAGVVAVSGGPDSVALAHACTAVMRDGKIGRLVLAHVNHQLRGEESDADEAFVAGLPAQWQTTVTCRTTRIDVARIAEADGENLEGTARHERYRWLTQVAREEGAAWIATGHTADDQAETVLFRLLRGSGLLGLGAIPECRPLEPGLQLIRPFLDVRRHMVLDYLSEHQIAFRVDSSNSDVRFARNRIRLELLPRLEQEYNVVEVLCRLAEQSQELYAGIALEAERLLSAAELPRAGSMLVFAADRLKEARPNLVREMFRLVWQREGWPMGDMDYDRWNRLAEIANGSRPALDFPGRIHVQRVGRVLQIQG